MNNDELLEITTEIGWRLLQSGAEIYRVEESIRRMLEAYGFPEAEVFSIPSCIIVTINDETGHALTRLKRNRSSGLDFDRIDQLNNLCRHICAETPELPVIQQKLAAIMDKKDYSFWHQYVFYRLHLGILHPVLRRIFSRQHCFLLHRYPFVLIIVPFGKLSYQQLFPEHLWQCAGGRAFAVDDGNGLTRPL